MLFNNIACLPSFLSLIFPKKTDAGRRLFLANASVTHLKINICVSHPLPYRRPNPRTLPSSQIPSGRDTSCPYRPGGPGATLRRLSSLLPPSHTRGMARVSTSLRARPVAYFSSGRTPSSSNSHPTRSCHIQPSELRASHSRPSDTQECKKGLSEDKPFLFDDLSRDEAIRLRQQREP